MDALKIKEAHVLGNSLGAQIATVMAMQAPKRVQSLILIAQNPPMEVCALSIEYMLNRRADCSATPQDDENREQFIFLKESCYERADDGSDQLASDVVHALHWIYFGDDPSAQGVIDEWVATTKFRPSNRKLIDKIFSAVLDRQPIEQKQWDKITCPALIIHGGKHETPPSSGISSNADRQGMTCQRRRQLHDSFTTCYETQIDRSTLSRMPLTF